MSKRNSVALLLVVVGVLVLLMTLSTFDDVITRKGDDASNTDTGWEIDTPTPEEITGEPYIPLQPQPARTCFTVDGVNFPCN